MTFALCVLASFVLFNLISVTYVSVFYHRGLSHRALELSPGLRWWVLRTGFWVTGVDPKGWTALHRMHHQHSDTERDPHRSRYAWSPLHVALSTMLAYRDYIHRLHAGDAELSRIAADVPWGVPSGLLRWMWWLPAVGWLAAAGLLGWATGMWGLSVGMLLGLEFILKTWIVNGLGHAAGYRNHDTPDTSVNSRWSVWLVGGESLHNNHHRYPSRANFAHEPGELDPASRGTRPRQRRRSRRSSRAYASGGMRRAASSPPMPWRWNTRRMLWAGFSRVWRRSQRGAR